MSELSNACGGSAPKHKLTALGKTYEVGLVTNEVKIAFEKDLYHRARTSVATLRGDMDPEDYRTMMHDLAEAYELGEFAMEGLRGKRFLGKPRGTIAILMLLIGVGEQEMINIVLDNEPEVQSVFRVVMQESFPGAKMDFSSLDGIEKKVVPNPS